MDEADRQLNILERWFCCCCARESNKEIKQEAEMRKLKREAKDAEEASSKNNGSTSNLNRKDLLGEGKNASGNSSSKSDGNRDARDNEIDSNLDALGDHLGEMLAQAKEMSETMNVQNEQIDRITKKTEQNSDHVQVATKRTENIKTGLFAF